MSETKPYTVLQRYVLFMVLLNAISVPIMLSSVNVALPAIAEDLSLSARSLSWIPTAFLMASAMFVLIFGRLADMYGRKKIFLTGAVAVILASLLAALANSAALLITARFLQGFGAAMLYATQMAIVSSVFPAASRGRVIGLVVSVIYFGLAGGPLLGGLLVDQLGWRANFLLQIPIAVLVLFVGVYKVKGEWVAEEKGTFDFSGALNYCLAIFVICLGVSLLPRQYSYLIIAAGLFGVVVFFQQAKSKQYPIWDVMLFFTNRVFTFSCLASFIIYSATFMNVVLLSLYLQYLKGLTATNAGMIMMIQPLTMAVFSPLMGKMSDHMEPRILASAGMAITAIGLVLFASLDSNSGTATIVTALIVTGLGFSLFSSPNVNAIMGSVEKKHLGAAAAAVSTTRILGQLMSMVLFTLVMALSLGTAQIEPSSYPALERTISFSFYLAAAVCLPGLYLSVIRGRVHGYG
ncbi:MAG: MFS transporter [Pseudomonadales bacterium]|jgi:EmrB/QacA subfamily drug resistance transporter|nr:MFS transporter [Pseudomonadales bacterium]